METIDKNYGAYKLNVLLLTGVQTSEEPDDDDYDDHYFPFQLQPLEDYDPTVADVSDFEAEYPPAELDEEEEKNCSFVIENGEVKK